MYLEEQTEAFFKILGAGGVGGAISRLKILTLDPTILQAAVALPPWPPRHLSPYLPDEIVGILG